MDGEPRSALLDPLEPLPFPCGFTASAPVVVSSHIVLDGAALLRSRPESSFNLTRYAAERGILVKQLGKTLSPAHRAAVSAAHRGKPKPLEQRERMSQAHIARRPPNLPLREVQRLERRRLYKRCRRERQRAYRVQKEKS
jgi:hypothetical protein